MPKYPNIKVKLTGLDGNAFVLMGAVRSAMKKAKVPEADIKQFLDDATSGDYSHLLGVCADTVHVY